MTYPDPTYMGEGGELTATHRPADSPPDWVYDNGTRVHYLARGTDNDGLFGLYTTGVGEAGARVRRRATGASRYP